MCTKRFAQIYCIKWDLQKSEIWNFKKPGEFLAKTQFLYILGFQIYCYYFDLLWLCIFLGEKFWLPKTKIFVQIRAQTRLDQIYILFISYSCTYFVLFANSLIILFPKFSSISDIIMMKNIKANSVSCRTPDTMSCSWNITTFIN